MSDAENRKSMDDVLASIRRIVRAEKSPAPEVEPAPEPEPPAAAEPLALTPDMRLEPSVEPQAPIPTPAPVAVPQAAPPAEMPAEQVTAAVMPALDSDQIRAMVRDVVIEELRGPYGDEIVRDIIRNELTAGEIGANISQNVVRMIQSEIAKRTN